MWRVEDWLEHRYQEEIPEPLPSLSQHWAQIGSLAFFFLITKIITVHQVCMSLHLVWSECEDKSHLKYHIPCEDGGPIDFTFFFFFLQNQKTPKLSPMADDAITRGTIAYLPTFKFQKVGLIKENVYKKEHSWITYTFLFTYFCIWQVSYRRSWIPGVYLWIGTKLS